MGQQSKTEILRPNKASVDDLCPDGLEKLRGNAVIAGVFFLSSLCPLGVLLWLTRRQKQAQIM